MAEFAAFSVALGYGEEAEHALSLADGSGGFTNGRDRFVNVDLGTAFGAVTTSLAYQRDTDRDGHDDYSVLSVDTPILPGLGLRSDAAYLDGADGSGVNALLQLRTAF